MRIRPAALDDAHRIADIHVASWRAAYRGLMPDPVLDGLSVDRRAQFWTRHLAGRTTHALVAEDPAGVVVGWADCGRCRDADPAAADGAAEVYGIYVDPGNCRAGVGRRLWAAACDRLAADGNERVAVWVLAANDPARRFYEAMGGRLDAAAAKVFEQDGAALPAVRYWCPVRPTAGHAGPG